MIGKTILHYTILSKLGSGGMGKVFLAEDTKLERKVALKFLPEDLTDDETALKRLLKEAKSASKINHPNVCVIYAIEEYNDTHFIVMEYVDGKTLREKTKAGALQSNEAVEYAIQIAQALKSAHDKNIIHRDIKSENIMINTENVVKVMDFGLAKIKDEAKQTMASGTAGTTAYMSPEQLQGMEIDHRADIWSFGVVLYEMLTGKFPFKGEYEAAIMYSIVNTNPEPMTDVLEDLQKIIKKTLTKNREERHQSAKDLLKDLKSVDMEIEADISVGKEQKPSIAVLPFRDMSPQKDIDYLCEGMAEDIINALTHIENLRVVARTSAFAFKDKQTDIREIGNKLDVESILEGSIQKAGDRLRITAQLINVADGYHLFSERYDRDMKDIFDIQDEISLKVVAKLKVKLFGNEEKLIEKHHTLNIEAYNLCLKGRFYMNSMTEKDLQKGLNYINQAISIDPDFALGYVILSDHYLFLGLFGAIVPKDAYRMTKANVKKALDIDNMHAEAHTSLGNIRCFFEWDWEEADKEFKRGIELNPGAAYVHGFYMPYLGSMGRTDEAVFQSRKSVELDPLSPTWNLFLGFVLFMVGRFDEAIEQLQKTIELKVDLFWAHAEIAWCYTFKNMHSKALELCSKIESMFPEIEPWGSATMGYMYAVAGQRDKAEKIIEFLTEQSKKKYMDPFNFAVIYTGLGDREKAFEWLEKAYECRSIAIMYMKIYELTWFRTICDDPRFKDILKRMRLDT